MKTIYTKTDEGKVQKQKVEDFATEFVKGKDVPSTDDVTPAKLVEDMVATCAKGIDYEWDSEGIVAAFGDELPRVKEIFKEVSDLVAASALNETEFKAAKEKEKADKEAAKEAEKARKKAEAEALAKRQESFLKGGVKGAEKADKDFKKSLTTLGKSLPTGITIAENEQGTGFGISVADGTTEAQIGEAIGYLARSDDNSEYARGAFQAFIGDLANATVDNKIYKSMIKAGKALSEKIKEATGREIAGRSIERFARLAQRCPAELRDVSKPSTLYVRVSDMSIPKKNEGESKEDYAKRVEKHGEDRTKIFKAIKDGYIEDGAGNKHEVKTVEHVSELIEQVQVAHKVKAPADPNKKSNGFWLKQYFFAVNAKVNLVGKIEEGVAVFADEDGTDTVDDGKTKVTKYTVAELTDLEEQAKNALESEFYTSKNGDLSDYMNGSKVVKRAKTEEVDGKVKTVKDDDGNVVMMDVTVAAVFPNPFSK